MTAFWGRVHFCRDLRPGLALWGGRVSGIARTNFNPKFRGVGRSMRTVCQWAFGFLAIAQVPAFAQVMYSPTDYHQAPAWQPVAGFPQATMTSKPVGNGLSSPPTGPSGWPYYTESPRYASWRAPAPTGFSGPANPVAIPWQSQPISIAITPTTAPVAANPPAPPIVPVSQPNPTVPVAAGPATAPPIATAPAAAPPAATSPPAAAANAKNEPFVDERVFLQGNKAWTEYDISGYTRRFSPADKPEEAIREWILKDTGEPVWHGGEVASLSVSPTKVTVYHTPAVQEQVAKLIGRFVWYMPGEFNARIRVVSARHVHWRKELLPRLQPAIQGEPGREAWFIDRADATLLVAEFDNAWQNQLLADREFRVVNGQTAQAFWPGKKSEYIRTISVEKSSDGGLSPYSSFRPTVEQTQDGVEVSFSPLIARDAATIEVDLKIKARKLSAAREVRLDAPGRPKVDVPEVATADFKARLLLPPGKLILCSLGLVPSIQNHRGLFGRDRPEELLLLLEIRPSQANTVAGQSVRPVVQPEPTPATRTASKPRQRRHMFDDTRPHVY